MSCVLENPEEFKEMSVEPTWPPRPFRSSLCIDVPAPSSARKLFSENPCDLASLRLGSPAGFLSPVNSRGASPCPVEPAVSPFPWSPPKSPPKLIRSTSTLNPSVVRSKAFKRLSPSIEDQEISPVRGVRAFFPDSEIVCPRPIRLSESSKCAMRRMKSDGRVRPYPGTRSAITPSPRRIEGEPNSAPTPKLPRTSSELCGVNVISVDTCAELVRGEHSDVFDNVLIIDCRFDYEYRGGHIQGSINLPTQEDVEALFFRNPQATASDRLAIVFHCEFSKHRGPKMYKTVREMDRKIHGLKHFPKLFYPEMYVLAGGYKNFYSKYAELCEPNGYTSMKDPRYVDLQKLCWKVWKSNKKELSRSRSLSDLRTKSPPDFRNFGISSPPPAADILSPRNLGAVSSRYLERNLSPGLASTFPPSTVSTSKRLLVPSVSSPNLPNPEPQPSFFPLRFTSCQQEELSGFGGLVVSPLK